MGLEGSKISWGKKTFLRPFLELPEFQTFFCPFSVLRIFRFLPLRHLLALPEFGSFFFGVYESARAFPAHFHKPRKKNEPNSGSARRCRRGRNRKILKTEKGQKRVWNSGSSRNGLTRKFSAKISSPRISSGNFGSNSPSQGNFEAQNFLET